MGVWVDLYQRRFYYGWVIVALASISMAFWYAFRTSFSLFFVALIDHFQWSRAETAGVQSLGMLVYMVMAPLVGYLVDRIGPRRVLLPGVLLMGLGLLLCTQIDSLFDFYFYFGIIAGVGVTCLSISPFTALLSHWFEKKRGTANGLASLGIGLGPLVFAPLLQYLIQARGWAFAFSIFGLLVFAIPLPLIALFLRHRPEDLGLHVDGVSSPPCPTPRRERWPEGQPGLKELIPSLRFWSFLLFPSLAIFSVYIVMVHHVRYLIDLGIDRIEAASLLASIGALSAGFRFFWGWISDRWGRERTYTSGVICLALGILFLILFQPLSLPFLLYLFALLFAAGWGSMAPMFMSIAGDLYKGRRFGLIYGMLEGMIGIGAAAGAWVAGLLFDRTQTYLYSFLLAILASLASLLLVWHVAPRKYRRDPTALPC
ncbi:MAG: MFS transporter [Desulfobacterota bacterium]|nr:MFS transporter [Thermodesulfobacteriota bacterium]